MAQQFTKKAIRDTFIELLNQKPLSKITVTEIVTACEINRNTFYYHYADIYELLSEIFHTELKTAIDEYNDTLSWEEGFFVATQFALNNKVAIYHVYNSMQREELENYLYDVAGTVMSNYIERESKNMNVLESDKKLIATFYQCALTGMVLQWISSGMKEDPEAVISRVGRLFDGNIALSLKRSKELDK